MAGKVITFMKSGGGVGATSLAVQTAYANRTGNLALLDLDIQYGAAAFQMDIEGTASILDLTAASERLDASLLQGAMARPHANFDLLAAPEGVFPLEDVTVRTVAKVIDIARSIYATVLIDLPPVWTDWVQTALAKSDHIVLVSQLTVPSIRQARRQIEMTKREALGHIPLSVVANRVNGGWFASGISQSEGEKALGRAINYLVPRHASMTAAANAGSPLSAVGGHALAKKLARMMSEIVSTASPSRPAVA
jgi:pilus assembly protein CpaE